MGVHHVLLYVYIIFEEERKQWGGGRRDSPSLSESQLDSKIIIATMHGCKTTCSGPQNNGYH